MCKILVRIVFILKNSKLFGIKLAMMYSTNIQSMYKK
jgi:hypothetical protein